MLNGIAETCIYAANLNETKRFYRDVLNLDVIMKEEERHVFFNCGDDMLLMFNPHHTRRTDIDGNPVQTEQLAGYTLRVR